MLEQLKYVNHLGETLFFGDWEGYFVNAHELYDFSWDIIDVNNRISGFDKKIQERSIPIRILCASKEEGIRRRNLLFEIPERDVLANQHGRLWINGYYCDCFVTASKKNFYSINGQYLDCDVTISTDNPFWVKERTISFDPSEASQIEPESPFLDHPYDYPYDFKVSVRGRSEFINTGFYDSRFRLLIHGYVEDPTIYINDNMYQVNTTVDVGEVLTIDSYTQTIYLTRQNGEVVNVFDARNRDHYIFEPITAGQGLALWDMSFAFDLILYEERSEPKWATASVTDDWTYYIDEHGHLIEVSPIGEESGYTFELKNGRLIMIEEDGAMENIDFALKNGRLLVNYG